jgi:hypothetical protein
LKETFNADQKKNKTFNPANAGQVSICLSLLRNGWQKGCMELTVLCRMFSFRQVIAAIHVTVGATTRILRKNL